MTIEANDTTASPEADQERTDLRELLADYDARLTRANDQVAQLRTELILLDCHAATLRATIDDVGLEAGAMQRERGRVWEEYAALGGPHLDAVMDTTS